MGRGHESNERGGSMILPLLINPDAEEDLAQARQWYDNQRSGLGNQFSLRVRETLDRIQNQPESFSFVRPPIRSLVTKQFPYSIVYRIDETQITVVAIYHTRRHPRGWQSRLH